MRTVQLTQGYETFVDDEDYDWISVHRWKILIASVGHLYAIRTLGRTGRSLLMHRAILGALPTEMVDHRNGNGLDNLRRNLRLATPAQNLANQRKAHGRSRFKGVYWNIKDGVWQAQIGAGRVNGKQKVRYLGGYGREEDAARAYDKAALELHGDFAMTNEQQGLLDPPDLEPILLQQFESLHHEEPV